LSQIAQSPARTPLASLITDPHRFQSFSHTLSGCLFDFSKQWADDDVLAQLLQLAEERHVLSRAQDMFAGKTINNSEQRAVLHPALRAGAAGAPQAIKTLVKETQQRMFHFAESVRNGTWRGYTDLPIRDVVHIGIGGSHLGPELVVNALSQYQQTHLNIHFVANIDAHELNTTLNGLNPETTLFIVVSKSFSTLETQVNATSARSWFLERTGSKSGMALHFIGVTSNTAAAVEFGLAESQLLPMWDWVGGRFSLWSAVGLPILLSIGSQQFQSFLDGARAADEHFIGSPARDNVPLLSALFATWNTNFLGAESLAVLPYDERLSLLSDYLQQLEMESNGKSVTTKGEAVQFHTMPVLWGGTGTRGQHAYHQLLHQGTRAYTADFITVRDDAHQRPAHHSWLVANALAQSQAMAAGQMTPGEPHKQVPGNHPTTTIVLDELGPGQLGTLLAVYEHKVFCQGVIWDINSFDQWGVELGKQLAKPIFAALTEPDTARPSVQDAATQGLINHMRK